MNAEQLLRLATILREMADRTTVERMRRQFLQRAAARERAAARILGSEV